MSTADGLLWPGFWFAVFLAMSIVDELLCPGLSFGVACYVLWRSDSCVLCSGLRLFAVSIVVGLLCPGFWFAVAGCVDSCVLGPDWLLFAILWIREDGQ